MSGDPRPDSIILWTRINDSKALRTGRDVKVQLQVSSDKDFATVIVNSEITASADYDHTLKVRVTNLDAASTYYYRFIYKSATSNTGRFKTAPASNADTSVKFAYVSCQDFIGRYYNTYLPLLEQAQLDTVDFIVHLGDYIYETTGDSSFQATGGERDITFTDTAGALKLGSGDKTFYAAQSLDNYRELYKNYRTDTVLQQIQENYAFIAIWDDHEFSDDSWQNHATYLDGAKDEANSTRKRNSERAYFEFMPIDHERVASDSHSTASDGSLSISEDQLFPNSKIYRNFRFGQHLNLTLADFRSQRPDHLIPEEAFPASIVMDESAVASVTATLVAAGKMSAQQQAGFKAAMAPYMTGTQLKNLSSTLYNNLLYALSLSYSLSAQEMCVELNGDSSMQFAIKALSGNIDMNFLNTYIIVGKMGLDPIDTTGLPKGLSYFLMGKTNLFGSLGSRYFVVKDTFDVYAFYKNYRGSETLPADMPYNTEQFAYLTNAVVSDDASWQVFGSSVSMSPLVMDLRPQAYGRPALADFNAAYGQLDAMLDSSVPSPFNQRFYLNVDHWDGLPLAKQTLISTFAQKGNVVTIAGDIHSHYASKLADGVFDLTTSSISSGTFGSYLDDGLTSLLSSAGMSAEQQQSVAALSSYYDLLIQNSSRDAANNPVVRTAKTREHGIAIATAGAAQFKVEFLNLPTELDGVKYVTSSLYDQKQTVLDTISQYSHTYLINKDEADFAS
ncbi:MAG: alkaline phosphatase D family protein [Oceanospirillaceae bacterium]|nr:alkaline phosphatase D family protein [Oceanospirillaceae bacterium]MCP5351236.1 alkaline phosphatase D family protein [Oceanospirillaceae bacterium]